MTMHQQSQLPISHLVSVVRLPQRGMPVRLVASDKELRALANAHGLIAVKSFIADLLVAKWRADGVKITGTVTAEIVQACSVTLEPLDAEVTSEIEATFVPEHSKLARYNTIADGEIILDAEGPDAPETFSGDFIDVGQLSEEFFELGIDPYPRKPGAALEFTNEAEVDDGKVSPFAKLAELRQKR